jgi:hypothetical protein
MINRSNALWGDVFACGGGVIGCAYDNGFDVIIEFLDLHGNACRGTQVVEFDEQVLYVRADINAVGEILVMGQGNESGRFLSRSVGGSVNLPARLTYGTHACDLDSNFNYVVQVSTTEYFDSLSNTYRLIPSEIYGTSNGIIQFRDGVPVWADLARLAIPQMVYPYRQNDIYTGEGATDPPHIQVLEGSTQKIVYYGWAARPRCAFDASANVFAICARGEHGVNFHFFSLPFTDLAPPVVVEPPPVVVEPPPVEVIEPPPVEPEEPDDMACTPVVPPQDVIQRSMDSLRQFCQTYEFQGNKPYVNDEIHENGLFIADGLIYFMMSDTGNWAKTLMNPDDKRDWESKRVSADNALFDYMRRRVGDAPASNAPGGTLSGNVNV